MSNYKFKTTNIKGKEYVEVNQRIKYFRSAEQYKGWSLNTDLVSRCHEDVSSNRHDGK